LHWYAGYVVGKMGPLPTILIVLSLAMPYLRRYRALVLTGIGTAIACALFCLYQRSQLHAEAEFMALLMTTAIASFRWSGIGTIAESRLNYTVGSLIAASFGLALIAWTIMFPPQTAQHGSAELIATYDAVIVPALFEQPADVHTIALIEYPTIMWGAADAWCRGQGDIFAPERSDLLDRKFGNVTCMMNATNSSIDLSKYNRVVYLRNSSTDQGVTPATFKTMFPSIVSRLTDCEPRGPALPGYLEVMVCGLRLPPTASVSPQQ
jgi:hypothetical protein